MRIVGLDIGKARVGVAVSDELGFTAQPLKVISATPFEEAIDAIELLVEEQGAGEVVVGIPKDIRGEMGRSAREVMEWVDELEKRLEVPVVTWDERFSTRAVEKMLIAADVKRKKRRKVVDKVAAAYLLQGYLDFRSTGRGS